MLVSERLEGLFYLMEDYSIDADSHSPLVRRLMAFAILSEMYNVIEQLKELNNKMVVELSEEAADIDFDLWLKIDRNSKIQRVFNSELYIGNDEDDATIVKAVELFPVGKSSTFNEASESQFITGLRNLNSDRTLNHSDIAAALNNGIKLIFRLLSEIKEKLTNISDELYENYCYHFLARDFDLVFQQVERDYKSWKEEHEWNSIQALEDKRTQEILKLLLCGVFKHSTTPTNREINDCIVKITPEALEHNTQIPKDIDVECARFARFVIMKECIMWLDYTKLGKYLFKHYKELTFEESCTIKAFDLLLDYIHRDMAAYNPKLEKFLKDYEEKTLEDVLNAALPIIETCNAHLQDGLPKDALTVYLKKAFYGDKKHDLQRALRRKAKHTPICRMLGMLKSTEKVFKLSVTSSELANSVSTIIKDIQVDSLERYINEGASDVKAQLSIWTTQYVRDNFLSNQERLFLKISK